MKHIQDIIPEVEKIVPAREAKNLPQGIGIYPLWEYGEKVKGKRLISFKPYVDPNKSAEENYRVLQVEAASIQAVFPSYRAPSLVQIKTLQAARKTMTREIMREGAIAEKSMPRASEVWFSRLA